MTKPRLNKEPTIKLIIVFFLSWKKNKEKIIPITDNTKVTIADILYS